MFYLFFESDKHSQPISIYQTGAYSPSFELASLENSTTNTYFKYPRCVFQTAELQELGLSIQGITNSYISQDIMLSSATSVVNNQGQPGASARRNILVLATFLFFSFTHEKAED